MLESFILKYEFNLESDMEIILFPKRWFKQPPEKSMPVYNELGRVALPKIAWRLGKGKLGIG